MKCFSLILGARNSGSKTKRFLPADEARIQGITARYFSDGFSILDVKGGWFDSKKNQLVREEARQILVYTVREATVRRWATELARLLNQQELLIVESGRAIRLKVKP